MSRLVHPPSGPIIMGAADNAPSRQDPGDDYSTRVAKYIPGEVLAGYVSLDSVVATFADGEPIKLYSGWVAFAICLVLTPIYLAVFGKPTGARWLHFSISTVAFLIWAYALGGPFETIGWYVPQVGAMALILFTLLSGLAVPSAGDQGE